MTTPRLVLACASVAMILATAVAAVAQMWGRS